MNDGKYKELIAQYIEAISGNHEIEFSYNGYDYCIQPDYAGKYEIWEYQGDEGGKVIATFEKPEELFSLKCFDGKNILEIEEQVIDGIVF